MSLTKLIMVRSITITLAFFQEKRFLKENKEFRNKLISVSSYIFGYK